MTSSWRRTVSLFSYESLELRRVLASAIPSANDQYVLELINSARANPVGYAASLGIDLNEGLAPETISSVAKPPLAFNYFLVDAAQKHSDWMLATDNFSHTGSGGSSPDARMQNAGYVFDNIRTWSENIGYKANSAVINPTEYARLVEESLFIDKGVSGRGHRKTLMSDNFMEIGIGARTGNYKGFNTLMLTQDFAKSTGPFLTGVAYSDSVLANRFYTPGEGLSGIVIIAIRDGSDLLYRTQTTAVGGYSLQLPKGRYSIMAIGTGLGESQFIADLLIGTANRKLDFIKGVVRKAPEVAVYGNSRSIVNKDNTPSATDGTFFGTTLVSRGSITKTYSIKNHGNDTLFLNGNTRVFTSTPEFKVTTLPPQNVAPGGTVTFSVTFDPNVGGTRTAVVQFANTDRLENPFTFSVSGIGADGIPPQGIPPQGILAYGGGKSQDQPQGDSTVSMFTTPISITQISDLSGHQHDDEIARDAAFRSLNEVPDETKDTTSFWFWTHFNFIVPDVI